MVAIDGTSEYGSEYDANAVIYSYSGEKHSCYLYLAQYNYEFPGLEEMVKVHFDTDDDFVYTQKNINNSYWGYGTNDNDYIYVTNHNGKGYIIIYTDVHKCNGVKDIIENSLVFN